MMLTGMTRRPPKLAYFTALPDLDSMQKDAVDRLPGRLTVSVTDLLCYWMAALTYLGDGLSDVAVCVAYWTSGRQEAALLVLVFVALPSVLLNILAFLWWLDDSRLRGLPSRPSCTSQLLLRLAASVLQLGPIVWYLEAIHFGRQFRRSRDPRHQRECYLRMLEADRDATLLRTFEAFMESAPQLIVQGTLAADALTDFYNGKGNGLFLILQCTSTLLSLLSLAWSLVVQHRCLRLSRQDKRNMSLLGSLLQLIWRLLTVLSRCMALVLFVLAFHTWLAVVLLVHYFLAVISIILLQPVDVGGGFCLEFGLILLAAVVHLFTPFNVAEGRTRYRYLLAYVIEGVESILMLLLCNQCASFDFPFTFHALIAYPLLFGSGIGTMILYYLVFHPNKRCSSSDSFSSIKRVPSSGNLETTPL